MPHKRACTSRRRLTTYSSSRLVRSSRQDRDLNEMGDYYSTLSCSAVHPLCCRHPLFLNPSRTVRNTMESRRYPRAPRVHFHHFISLSHSTELLRFIYYSIIHETNRNTSFVSCYRYIHRYRSSETRHWRIYNGRRVK